MHDFDLLVVGHETEGVLAAVAAARAGAQVGLVVPPGRALGGLLTEGGLAYVDRDARHLVSPSERSDDGLFGAFLARAGVELVALEPARGEAVLEELLVESGVRVLRGTWTEPRSEGDRLCQVTVAGEPLAARAFIDATPDGDLLEALGARFTFGFSEHGSDRVLGVSPLPRVRGVTPGQILDTCERLAADGDLLARKERVFGPRRFLELDHGPDYVLVGPPLLALAFGRWREREGLAPPLPFEADGFNIAVLGPADTSWNGLIYFSSDRARLLEWSRCGADATFEREVEVFGRWLREDLGWSEAEAELPGAPGVAGRGEKPGFESPLGEPGYRGVYVRQTRHLLDTRLRLSLPHIATNAEVRSVGTFCYYPDFRGFRVTPTSGPLVAQVAIDAGLPLGWRNVAIASRSGGYTPMAHSLCRLVQYNATLGAGLGVAAALGCAMQPFATTVDMAAIADFDIRRELDRLGILAADAVGLERNAAFSAGLREDPYYNREAAGLA